MERSHAPAEKTAVVFNWPAFWFILAVHLGGAAGAYWLSFVRFSWPTLYLALGMYFAAGFSITAGYHRCFAHPAYKAHPAVRAMFLIFGTAAFGGSALKWCSDHRKHHAHTDKAGDPYDATRGFWWSHMGWVFYKDPKNEELKGIDDLERDPWMQWQHRWFYAIAAVVAIGIPCLLAWSWGDLGGGLFVAFFLRTLVELHIMFCVNSVAHTFGRKTWARTVSARDNRIVELLAFAVAASSIGFAAAGYVNAGVFMLLCTMGIIGIGELLGHSFHHAFQRDYRNGPYWWNFDPTRWLIRILALAGLARSLCRTPSRRIQEVAAGY